MGNVIWMNRISGGEPAGGSLGAAPPAWGAVACGEGDWGVGAWGEGAWGAGAWAATGGVGSGGWAATGTDTTVAPKPMPSAINNFNILLKNPACGAAPAIQPPGLPTL